MVWQNSKIRPKNYVAILYVTCIHSISKHENSTLICFLNISVCYCLFSPFKFSTFRKTSLKQFWHVHRQPQLVRVCWYPLIYLSQLHLHRLVHCHPPFLQPNLVPYPLALLHAHLTSWLQASDAIGSVVQKGSQALLSLSRVQPHSSGVQMWSKCLLLGLVSSGPYACLVDSTL